MTARESLSSCRAVRRLLEAHHDEELGIEEQIGVEAHLFRCTRCAERRAELTWIQTLLRQAAGRFEREAYDPVHADDVGEDALDRALSGVVDQVVRERRQGWPGRLDRALVAGTAWWIPSGALAVTTVAAAALAAVLTVLTPTHSQSLAAVLLTLGSPGSNLNPVMVARGVTLPQLALDLGAPSVLGVLNVPSPTRSRNLALSAVVTREGEISQYAILQGNGMSDELLRDLSLLTSASRFKPALFGGLPVAVNVVWLLEQTTVRPLLDQTMSERRPVADEA